MDSLHQLMIHELRDLYDAEHQITEALPLMAKAAKDSELKAAFNEHLEQTRQQITRLERVFESLDERPQRKLCKGMRGLIQEGQETLEEEMDDVVRGAALIAAAQRIEHYEMAGYGTARTFAYLMGHEEAARLLQQTLDEEEQTDKRLTRIANNINVQAME